MQLIQNLNFWYVRVESEDTIRQFDIHVDLLLNDFNIIINSLQEKKFNISIPQNVISNVSNTVIWLSEQIQTLKTGGRQQALVTCREELEESLKKVVNSHKINGMNLQYLQKVLCFLQSNYHEEIVTFRLFWNNVVNDDPYDLNLY